MKTNVNFTSKRNDLIRTSLQLFLEKGYENTKVSDILLATGLSKGGMYHYFSSKEEILDAVVGYALEEERPLFEQKLSQTENTLEQFECFISNEVLSTSDFRKKIIVWKKNEESPFVKYRIRELNTKFEVPYLQKIIENGIQEGVFQTEYPKEMGEYFYLIGEKLFIEFVYYYDESECINRSNAFLDIVSSTLHTQADIQNKMNAIFHKAIQNQLQEVSKQ